MPSSRTFHEPAATVPPSTGIVEPVTKLARSDARNTMTAAHSSGVPVRPSGVGCRPGMRRRNLQRGRRLRGGWDHVGGDTIDSDGSSAEFHGERLGKLLDGGFHRRIHGKTGSSVVGLDRCDVDDRPAVSHQRHGGPYAVGDRGKSFR